LSDVLRLNQYHRLSPSGKHVGRLYSSTMKHVVVGLDIGGIDRDDGALGESALPSQMDDKAGTARRTVRKHVASVLPVRKNLPHNVPSWVGAETVFFITICIERRGTDTLCRGNLPTQLWEGVLHRTRSGQWWPHLFLVMPDHLHAVLSFAPDPGMRVAIRDWKRFMARMFDIGWQRDFFDHRLRKDESFVEKAHYIRMNPVRAGLVEKPDLWPYSWTIHGALGESALPSQIDNTVGTLRRSVRTGAMPHAPH